MHNLVRAHVIRRAKMALVVSLVAAASFAAFPSPSSAAVIKIPITTFDQCLFVLNGCPTITASPASPSGSSTASFTFTYPGNLATYTCTLDGAATICGGSAGLSPLIPPIPGTLPVTKTYTGLADGQHTFTVSGNLAQSVCISTDPITHVCIIPGYAPSASSTGGRAFTWVVDTTAPVASFTSGPADLATITKDNTAFGFTSDDITPTTFKCSVDGKTAGACSSPFSITGLNNGVHKLQVTPTDQLGHIGTTIQRSFAVNLPSATSTVTLLSNGKVRTCKRVKVKKHGHVVRKRNGKIKYKKKCTVVKAK